MCDEARGDLVHVNTLEQRVLLCVYGLAAVRLTARRARIRATMREGLHPRLDRTDTALLTPERVGVLYGSAEHHRLLVTVRETRRASVVARRQDVTTSVRKHAPHREPMARRPPRHEDRHLHEHLVLRRTHHSVNSHHRSASPRFVMRRASSVRMSSPSNIHSESGTGGGSMRLPTVNARTDFASNQLVS